MDMLHISIYFVFWNG